MIGTTTFNALPVNGFKEEFTLSSPDATLKASSSKQPTAMRTALDECISFHTVSLSTYIESLS